MWWGWWWGPVCRLDLGQIFRCKLTGRPFPKITDWYANVGGDIVMLSLVLPYFPVNIGRVGRVFVFPVGDISSQAGSMFEFAFLGDSS